MISLQPIFESKTHHFHTYIHKELHFPRRQPEERQFRDVAPLSKQFLTGTGLRKVNLYLKLSLKQQLSSWHSSFIFTYKKASTHLCIYSFFYLSVYLLIHHSFIKPLLHAYYVLFGGKRAYFEPLSCPQSVIHHQSEPSI